MTTIIHIDPEAPLKVLDELAELKAAFDDLWETYTAVCVQRNTARDEVKQLTAERDRYREALERIDESDSEDGWAWKAFVQRVVCRALDGES